MQHELVLRAQAGDREAFAELVRGTYDGLARTARLILRDDDLAADAVQESLVAAWVHLKSVRDPDRFGVWLHRLVVHACYREARRSNRRSVLAITAEPVDPATRGDPLGPIAISDQLERAFRRLTPDHRAVLVVHHYLGLRDDEAALVLDVPAGTVKSRLSRATSALRAAIEADERAPATRRESTA
jgi:RNA polymerase sigma-70 factor, ECF subfamily